MGLFNPPEKRKPAFRLALLAFCVAIVVVVLGAFTRLVDAGLGCPDWPGCYGHLLWPNESHEIARAEELYPHAPVELDKTWPEMVHRYAAGSLGILIVILAWTAWKQREQRNYPFRLPLFLLFVVVWQALFGMWTVTLKLWPQVVTLHLIGGFTVLSLLWLMVLRLSNRAWQVTEIQYSKLMAMKPWAIAALVLVIAQIALGGWTSSNYAAYACTDFPTCHGVWVPDMDFARGFNILQHIGPNYLGGMLESDARTAIHYTHRLGAIVVTVFLLGLIVRLLTFSDRRIKGMGLVVLGALAIQVGLGIANVLFHIPLSLAVLHNAGGALLLLTVITLLTGLWMVETKEEN
ncbi:MAG: cytochrome B [Porticoccaceae bacterium]|nr:cytochrome B [Porticoccaceae bacterium]